MRGVRDAPEGGEFPAAIRFAGLGLELAGSTLGLAAVGYGVDAWLGNPKPVATAAGALLGFAAGMYRLIVLALRASADEPPRRSPTSTPDDDDRPSHDRPQRADDADSAGRGR